MALRPIATTEMNLRIAAALGITDLKFSNMQWGGGGGGGSGAIGNAAAAIHAGLADCIVVYRALAQGQFACFGQGNVGATVSGEPAFNAPYGVMSPAQKYGMRNMRFIHEHDVPRSALRAVSMASYHHACQSASRHVWPTVDGGQVRQLALDL